MWTPSSRRRSGRRTYLRAAAAMLATLLPAPVCAQRLPPQIPPLGTQLRVLLRDSTRTYGRLIEATPETIALRRLVGANEIKVVDRTIPVDSVLTVWRGAGTRWGIGALIGAIAASTVVMVAASQGGDRSGEPCDVGCWASSVGILSTVAAIGGLLGGLIGHGIVHWEIVPGG
jgi:hypothetical protein